MGENSEIAFSVFGLPIRWYALAYLAGIFIGYWYLLKLIAQPGAPMARRHADDMIFYAMLGIIFGGRLGYVAVLQPRQLYPEAARDPQIVGRRHVAPRGVIGVLDRDLVCDAQGKAQLSALL